MSDIDVSIVPLLPQQAGDHLIAVRNGAIVRVTLPMQSSLALVATTGNYGDLSGLPDLSLVGLGAAAAAQGLLAETAVQPAGLLAFETVSQLNARDLANRDRGNHTGTQSTATITDFAAVAAAAAPVQSVAGKTGAVTLTKPDVGLGNVDNTSDLAKPISTAAQSAFNLKANAASLAAVATSGQYSALLNIPETFTPSSHDQPWSTITSTPTTLVGYGIVDAATLAQGAKADTAVQPGAIANFETTTQLNSRDVNNRARTNHTGTQPASTVTGLATVATSGAYADLSGRPTIPAGFVYDQQGEPVGPAAGATWRERSAGGLILGEWEWSGSLWLSNGRYAPLYSAVSASANTSAVMSVYPKYPALLTGYSVSLNQPFAAQDGSNYWFFRHGGLDQGDWLTTIGVSTIGPTFLQRILATPMVVTNPSQSDNFASRVGTPGNLRQFQAITHYRLIRS